MDHSETSPSREHERGIILQKRATHTITAPTSLFGRFYTFIKSTSTSLKDTIDSSEDVFIHEHSDTASTSGASCADYETEIEDNQGLYQSCSSETMQGATLSDVKAFKDQLEKLLSDEAPLENGSPEESLSLRLYLGNLVDNGHGIMVPVAADLTPLLSSEQGFLYYAIDDPETHSARLRSPAAIMASSITLRLTDLENSQSMSLATDEQGTLSKLRQEMATISDKANTDDLFNQAASLQQLRSISAMIDALATRAAAKFQDIEYENLPSQPQPVAPGSMANGKPTMTTLHLMKQQVLRPTFDHNTIIQVEFDDAELAPEELHEFDDWARQMSRFDTHLPAELRRARTLAADMTVLKYGIDVLLKHYEMLTEVERSYLSGLRQSIEEALEGQSRRETRKFWRYQDRVWDTCWSIYFDLTEHMDEEVENFLGQLFHGRTSGCSYGVEATLKKNPKKRKEATKKEPAAARVAIKDESPTSDD